MCRIRNFSPESVHKLYVPVRGEQSLGRSRPLSDSTLLTPANPDSFTERMPKFSFLVSYWYTLSPSYMNVLLSTLLCPSACRIKSPPCCAYYTLNPGVPSLYPFVVNFSPPPIPPCCSLFTLYPNAHRALMAPFSPSL